MQADRSCKTISEMRRTIRVALSAVGRQSDFFIDPAYEADEMLRLLCGRGRASLFSHPEEPVSPETCQRLEEAVKRRSAGEPLAYILGVSPFFGRDFDTAPGCLIPRADTEVLVEEAIRILPPGTGFWDLCTGSGCIPCSVLAERPDIPRAFGLELSAPARAVAEKNRLRHGLASRFSVCAGDVLKGDRPPDASLPHLITANPPYIRSEVCGTLDTQVQAEPRTALDGGPDGLLFYRAILANYRNCLASGGCFLFEIGYDQGKELAELADTLHMTCEIRRDYSGHDRAVRITP